MSNKLYAYVIRLLSRHAYSEHEVRQKLQSRPGALPEEIEATLARLKKQNLINDLEFTQWFVDYRLRNHKGPRLILMQLHKKGIDRQLANRVLKEKTSHSDLEESAEKQLQKKLSQWKHLPKEKVYSRAVGLLSRLGFSSQITYTTVKKVLTDID